MTSCRRGRVCSRRACGQLVVSGSSEAQRRPPPDYASAPRQPLLISASGFGSITSGVTLAGARNRRTPAGDETGGNGRHRIGFDIWTIGASHLKNFVTSLTSTRISRETVPPSPHFRPVHPANAIRCGHRCRLDDCAILYCKPSGNLLDGRSGELAQRDDRTAFGAGRGDRLGGAHARPRRGLWLTGHCSPRCSSNCSNSLPRQSLHHTTILKRRRIPPAPLRATDTSWRRFPGAAADDHPDGGLLPGRQCGRSPTDTLVVAGAVVRVGQVREKPVGRRVSTQRVDEIDGSTAS